jgi:hypothetical protein
VKDDRLYLHHMLERCRRITRFIEPGRAAFMASEESQDAVIRFGTSPLPGYELLAVLEQPLQSVLPLRCFRRQPDKHEFVDCRPNVEALRNEEYAGTVIPGGPECTEVSWHRAGIM